MLGLCSIAACGGPSGGHQYSCPTDSSESTQDIANLVPWVLLESLGNMKEGFSLLFHFWTSPNNLSLLRYFLSQIMHQNLFALWVWEKTYASLFLIPVEKQQLLRETQFQLQGADIWGAQDSAWFIGKTLWKCVRSPNHYALLPVNKFHGIK
jgi:hypothetical protein